MRAKKIVNCFRRCLCLAGDDAGTGTFFRPRINRFFIIRLTLIAVVAVVFFGYICVPAFVVGESMEPTYGSRGFNFCWRPAYWFGGPERGDVAVIRYAGKKLYLKRIIGLPGDRIAFEDGKLMLNGTPLEEPCVRKPCDWELAERTVPEDRVYVVGDNRSMPIELHEFGAVRLDRLYGKPLW